MVIRIYAQCFSNIRVWYSQLMEIETSSKLKDKKFKGYFTSLSFLLFFYFGFSSILCIIVECTGT